MLIKCSILFLAIALFCGYYIFYDPFDPACIKGKRVVVTGASTGIGEQIAYHYAKLGARLLITARREERLKQVVSECKHLGAEDAMYVPLDMGNPNHTKFLIDEARLRLGGLDHLILNHIQGVPMEPWSIYDVENNLVKSFEVNFNSYVRLATYATELLTESRGSIAVVSSVLGQISFPFSGIYCAAKFALHGFFDSLRLEFQLQNIDVSITTFVLGTINTTNAKEVYKHMLDSEKIFSTPAEDTAYRIMTGTANRERQVFYPLSANFIRVVRDIVPGQIDKISLTMFNEDGLAKLLKKQAPGKR